MRPDEITKKLHALYLELCKMAYDEGREHQQEDDFPDVGMYFYKTFEDTKAYKAIMENKP